MKLISLNTWGGKVFDPLISFIKKHSPDTDIFCFQEVFKTTTSITESFGFRTNLYNEFAKILKNHKGYFSSAIDNYLVGSFQKNLTDYNLSSGLAIFVAKDLHVISSGDFSIYREKNNYDLDDFNTMPRNAQYVLLTKRDKKFTICNLHGIWLKEGKKDAPVRLEQSKKIKEFLEKQTGEKILVGDFNLDINTKSIEMFEPGMINLIKKYQIPTTRNEFSTGSDKYADYTFVSPNVKVTDFQVPNINVSDHLPMILEFS